MIFVADPGIDSLILRGFAAAVLFFVIAIAASMGEAFKRSKESP